MVHTVESRFSKLFGQELKLNRVLTPHYSVDSWSAKKISLYQEFSLFYTVTKSGLCCIQ